MNPHTLRLLFIPTLCLLAGVHVAAASPTETNPFHGIVHIERTDWPEIPRPVKAQILIVDLDDPGISFRLTEPESWTHPDPEQAYTRPEATLDYLKRVEAQVAINAHFYSHVPLRNLTELRFLAASEGTPYSKIEGAEPALNIDSENNAHIVTQGALPPTYETNPPVELHNSVGGNERLVFQGGNTAGDGSDPYYNPRARTAAGLTRDHRTLVIIVVEEGMPGVSRGVTPRELADMLIEYEVWDAANFDGGGSTGLAMADPEPRLVAGTGARDVGSNLAIFADPLPEEAEGDIIVDNSEPGFRASDNWETASAGDAFQQSYRWRQTEEVTDRATWTVHLANAGKYRVYARWPQSERASAAAPYSVHHSSGTDAVEVNQQKRPGKWTLLGVYHLEAGLNDVQLSCWIPEGDIVLADAIRWVENTDN